MKDIKQKFIKQFSDYLRTFALPNGYYKYSIIIHQNDEGETFSYFQEELTKITEKQAHG